jgi:hypothetical protein
LLIIISALIYNDFNVFGTCYAKGALPPPSSAAVKPLNAKASIIKGPPANKTDYNCVYPFGVDPIWFLSVNNGIF